MKKLAAATSLLLVTACGLPLSGGVQKPGPVPAEQRQGGDIQVLPPAPRDDAPPDQVVRDFFGAQSSPGDAHASAREFLAPGFRAGWHDDGPVSVLGSVPDVVPLDGTATTFRVRVSGTFVGQIAPDGSYVPEAGPIDQLVQLRKGARGRWQITDVPDGLLLSRADRERSFRARNIYFLAPPSSPGSEPSHVVPDQVFMPVTAGSADALVRRLLAGPSQTLGDSVGTAFPTETKVRSVRTEASGLVTVDLTQQVRRASAQLRDQMLAQLVWTLKALEGFSELRLLGEGRPLGEEGDDLLRDRDDLRQYDPDGLVARAPLYYIGGRRLRLLEPAAGPTSAASSRQVVDIAAVSPRGGSLALITYVRGGAELKTGPPSGPFAVRARATTLAYPTWGSGEKGLWFLRNRRLTLAPLAGGTVDVPVDGIGRFGPISGVRVSRDGVRVGIIAGIGTKRRLLVGRVVERDGRLRVAGLRSVAPGVADVGDLSWDSATSLVVLGRASGVTAPVRVSVDGSSVALVNRLGLEQSSVRTIAAAPLLPLVVGAVVGDGPALFRDNGGQYVPEPGVVGEQPFYPG
ncbi:MAG: GerMN domain-containing protein [Frankiaceae bacterium]|nr:GerMN domain-containing protein [Frankiaceae bacterium]